MRYSIRECELYGLLHPFLFFSGWVESDAVYLEIRNDNQLFYRIDFEPTKSKTHSFSVRTALKDSKLSDEYHVVISDTSGELQEITRFHSSPYSRFKQTFKPDKFKLFKEELMDQYNHYFKGSFDPKNSKDYNRWIKEYETFHEVEDYTYQPLLSVIIPVYNVEEKLLRKCLDSICNQTYQKFEICLADDCSTNPETITTLQWYEQYDKRIKVVYRKENGHISNASNSALELATGEFIIMMDNDDELMPQAFNEVVRVLNKQPDLDFIYTDEDKINMEGYRSDPQFKPDLALDKLYGGNYICHLNIVRKTVIEKVGGFRVGYEGAQDFDLFLRISEVTDKFYHIPKVLYHWRMVPGSTALDASSKNYAGEAGKRALEDYFKKKHIDVQIKIVISTHYFVEYLNKEENMVNIIMLVSNPNDLWEKRAQAFSNALSYLNYKFTFISDEPELIDHIMEDTGILYTVIERKGSLAATINNWIANGKDQLYVFLNEYAEAETFDLLELMSGYSQQSYIGAVGVKVLNKNKHVMDGGNFLVDDALLPTNFITYSEDYGIYGTLLVPNNYQIVEDRCFMVSKNAFEDVQGLSEEIDEADIYYDLCLRLSQKGYRNVILPQVEIKVDVEDPRHALKESTIQHWKNQGFNTVSDKYYNENLSTKAAFRIRKEKLS